MLDAELLTLGLKFHGHKCPAMPMGLRAGVAAMQALGVERSQDKELHAVSETGEGHAAGCFLDGVMTATGCTFGKGNIEKLRYHKMAFTLIDVRRQKAVRVSLKPEFFAAALEGPFVAQRKAGILPQDIDPKITDPLVERYRGTPGGEIPGDRPRRGLSVPDEEGDLRSEAVRQMRGARVRGQAPGPGRRAGMHPLLGV